MRPVAQLVEVVDKTAGCGFDSRRQRQAAFAIVAIYLFLYFYTGACAVPDLPDTLPCNY